MNGVLDKGVLRLVDIVSNSVSRLEYVWNSTWHVISEDILHKQRKILQIPSKDLIKLYIYLTSYIYTIFFIIMNNIYDIQI